MPTVAELQERRDQLELERQVAALEAEVHVQELAARMVLPEAWGDRVATDEYLYDGKGMSDFGLSPDGAYRMSRPQDRYRGDNAPIWRTEAEHAKIRGVARVIAAIDEVGGSALENLTNYIIGQGMTYVVSPAKEMAKTSEAEYLAAKAQDIVDQFLEKNAWWGDGEREAFTRSRRDGEQHLVLYPDGPVPSLRLVDPSFVTEPDKPRQLEEFLGLSRGGRDEALDWKYGQAAPWNDSSKTDWLFVSWYGDPMEWEAIPAERFVHLKLNVDREVKRGVSDFYPVYRNLQNADKLLQNVVQGEAIRQAIAYIREHADGVKPDHIKTFRGGMADQRISQARSSSVGGSYNRYGREIRPGTVVDVVHGAKYHDGPTSTQRGAVAVEIVQAALRIVGIRWQMPEYMISGDSSNSNFASTLVAEAPFTKSAEAKQTYYCQKYEQLIWKVLAMAFQAGSFPLPPHRAKRMLSVSVTGPEIAVRNRLEDHEIRKEECEAGILSKETWAAEAGRDYAEEQEKGAEEKVEVVPTANQPGEKDEKDENETKQQGAEPRTNAKGK